MFETKDGTIGFGVIWDVSSAQQGQNFLSNLPVNVQWTHYDTMFCSADLHDFL